MNEEGGTWRQIHSFWMVKAQWSRLVGRDMTFSGQWTELSMSKLKVIVILVAVGLCAYGMEKLIWPWQVVTASAALPLLAVALFRRGRYGGLLAAAYFGSISLAIVLSLHIRGFGAEFLAAYVALLCVVFGLTAFGATNPWLPHPNKFKEIFLASVGDQEKG